MPLQGKEKLLKGERKKEICPLPGGERKSLAQAGKKEAASME